MIRQSDQPGHMNMRNDLLLSLIYQQFPGIAYQRCLATPFGPWFKPPARPPRQPRRPRQTRMLPRLRRRRGALNQETCRFKPSVHSPRWPGRPRRRRYFGGHGNGGTRSTRRLGHLRTVNLELKTATLSLKTWTFIELASHPRGGRVEDKGETSGDPPSFGGPATPSQKSPGRQAQWALLSHCRMSRNQCQVVVPS